MLCSLMFFSISQRLAVQSFAPNCWPPGTQD
jgi:hypothetical protein